MSPSSCCRLRRHSCITGRKLRSILLTLSAYVHHSHSVFKTAMALGSLERSSWLYTVLSTWHDNEENGSQSKHFILIFNLGSVTFSPFQSINSQQLTNISLAHHVSIQPSQSIEVLQITLLTTSEAPYEKLTGYEEPAWTCCSFVPWNYYQNYRSNPSNRSSCCLSPWKTNLLSSWNFWCPSQWHGLRSWSSLWRHGL